MGTSYSSIPECGINKRALLNTATGTAIIQKCANDRVAYIWGIIFVVSTLLLIGYFMTKEYEHEEEYPRKHFYVPLWVPAIPIMFGVFYSMTNLRENQQLFKTEELEFQLSDMSKKDYLHYKSGDDRTNTAFTATAMSAGILATTNLFTPFLRADR